MHIDQLQPSLRRAAAEAAAGQQSLGECLCVCACVFICECMYVFVCIWASMHAVMYVWVCERACVCTSV